ncbi:hypothetical protein ENBRE01_2551 [Enteropsectra breve]|nr:hypothetical protein ENBRE01_2551 [Enteropsectra breve]
MSAFNEELEDVIAGQEPIALVHWMMEQRLLKNEKICACGETCSFASYKRSVDECAWRCYNKRCNEYKKYVSIRSNSWFEKFSLSLRRILKIIFNYSIKQTRHSIISSTGMNKETVFKIINSLIELIPETDFSENKFGGPGMIIQIDETMLNHAVKNHRKCSPLNKTDALIIVECLSRARRIYSCMISDKKTEALIPIKLSQVASNSKIYTDEHRSYSPLMSFLLGIVQFPQV